MNEEVEMVSYEDAIGLLPEGDTVHTFRSRPGVLIGEKMNRDDLLTAMRASPFINRTVGVARSMKYGLCIYAGEPLFIETKE